MQYTWLIKVTTLYSFLNIKCSTCHLKDLGESRTNWTSVLQHIEKKIHGGTPAFIHQYPHNVQFANYGGLCGGSILTKKIVITAAHCFDLNKNITEMKIFTKSRYLFDVKANGHDVWDFQIHERYGKDMVFANDIALIIVHDNFIFGTEVQKVNITDSILWVKENENFTVSGWGETEAGNVSVVLRETYLHYINKNSCMELNELDLGPEMFCLFGDGKRDTCRGDSGGAVLWKGELVGLVSHGRGCGVLPGVYVNVFYYKSWIYKTVKKLYKNFCDFHR